MAKNQKPSQSSSVTRSTSVEAISGPSGIYRDASTGEFVAVATRGRRSDKSDKVELRVTSREKRLLQEASRQTNETLSAFVLASSIERARSLLSEQTNFVMSEEEWKRFNEALDAPPRLLPRLSRLMKDRGYGE